MKKTVLACLIVIVGLVLLGNLIGEIIFPLIGLVCVALSLLAVGFYIKKHSIPTKGGNSQKGGI